MTRRLRSTRAFVICDLLLGGREAFSSDLERAVKKMYERVALEPNAEFHFELGRQLAERLELLKQYPWPGNVRELANVVERMSVLATDSQLGIDDLPEEIRDQVRASQGRVVRAPQLTTGETVFPTYHDAVLDAKRQILKEALRRSDKVQTRAAKLLGITQPYMARLMKNLDVRKNDV